MISLRWAILVIALGVAGLSQAQPEPEMTPERFDQLASSLETRMAAIKAESQAILARNATLSRKSKLPLWASDAAARINSMAYMDAEQWWRWGRPKPHSPPGDAPPGELGSLPRLGATTGFTEFTTYLGSFRVPDDTCSNEGVPGNGWNNYTYGSIAYSSATKFFASNGYCLAEYNIPTLTTNADPSLLNVATAVQGWTEGNAVAPNDDGFLDEFAEDINSAAASGLSLPGLLLHGGRLIVSGYGFYGTPTGYDISHFALNNPSNIAGSVYPGAVKLWNGDGLAWVSKTQGFVGQYMGPIPGETHGGTTWQEALQGEAFAGGSTMSVVERTSGACPSFIAFDPDNINVQAEPVTGLGLMYCGSVDGWSSWHSTADIWGGVAGVGGAVFFNNTRTVMWAGWNGTGVFCYGDTVNNVALHNPPDGPCHDPEYAGSHGQSSWPYVYKYWLVDALDFLRVKNGEIEPWEIDPYKHGTITFPYTDREQTQIRGIYYDSANKKLYICQIRAEAGKRLPVIHVYSIDDTP